MSVVTEILALCQLFHLPVKAVRHWIFASEEITLLDGSGISELFNFTVPAGKCLLVTHIHCQSYPVDLGGDGYLFSHRQQTMFVDLPMLIAVDGESLQKSTDPASYYEGEVFLVFPAQSKVSFQVNILVSDVTFNASFRLTGFILPQHAHERLSSAHSIKMLGV